jgi:N-methylhydantoinase A/oxoprolinase/acetone carboxylase beta subunit
MQLGLGIDTGGTFTDVALYDFNTNKVIDSAKAV